MMSTLFFIFIGALLVNNFVLVRFLGICPFLGVSKQLETAVGMGMAVTFVMTLAGVVTWALQHYVLNAFGLAFLQTVLFILVIAALVQFVELFLKKMVPVLYRALGIFLPLITTNCAILGIALLIAQREHDLIQTVVFCVGAGLGFTLALVIMAGIREEMQFAPIPKSLQGAGIALITAGLMSIAFSGFAGLVPM
ncbi:MAG: electron transport complex subunit RsxA [Firmicutes bacterium]|nr:electron transport complex subunit RsxA [Bacillota bacterium]